MAGEQGFTLIEIAIVVLVIGLLLGGVFKGQELITAARVRSMIAQQDEIRTAFLGFSDRFLAPPGDYALATTNIGGVGTTCGNGGNGNGNGRIEIASGESVLAWEHLSRAGFFAGTYRCTGDSVVDATTTPVNMHNQFLQLAHDGNYAGTNVKSRHNLKTGNQLPSALMAELDRKIDDGNALEGIFRGSTYTTGAAVDATCWDATTGAWAPAAANCSGARIF